MGLQDHVDAQRRAPNSPDRRVVVVEAQWEVKAPADQEAVTAAFRRAETFRASLGGPGPDVIPRPITIRPEGDRVIVAMREVRSEHVHAVRIEEQRPPVYRDGGERTTLRGPEGGAG